MICLRTQIGGPYNRAPLHCDDSAFHPGAVAARCCQKDLYPRLNAGPWILDLRFRRLDAALDPPEQQITVGGEVSPAPEVHRLLQG